MRNIIIILAVIIIGGALWILFTGGGEKDGETNVNNEDNLTTPIMENLRLSSAVFEHNGLIPAKYTCDAEGINPPLSISGVPGEAKSLVLIMDDPDIPQAVKDSRGIDVFDHWVKFNIATSTADIIEGIEPEGVSGVGSGGDKGYRGPCPPDREHRYIFKLYALDIELDLEEGSTKSEVETAMEGHILEQTELVGRYKRQ